MGSGILPLTAKSLSNNEKLFGSVDEMSKTYYEHIKQIQHNGPYALTAYSLDTTVAFELAKTSGSKWWHGRILWCTRLPTTSDPVG